MSLPIITNILNINPLVVTYDNFVSKDECEHFIKISNKTLEPALVSDQNKGVTSQGRTGMNTWLDHSHDDITLDVATRISNIVNIPLENAEKYQVIYYDTNQEYRRHYDSWDHNGSDKTQRCMKYGGARLVTALVYLNDVQEGGETKMTRLNIDVKPLRGRLLVFHNTHMLDNKSHDKHLLSEHAGSPVVSGEKYAFNLWFKECHSKILYSKHNPSYYTNVVEDIKPQQYTSDTKVSLDPNKYMFRISNALPHDSVEYIMRMCSFKDIQSRPNCWVKNESIKPIIDHIENLTNISKDFYENIHITKYKVNEIHGAHYVAYDLTSDNGKKCTATNGQRMFTITIFLTDNMTFAFNKIGLKQNFNKGDIIFYKNTVGDTNTRDDLLNRTLTNGDAIGYIANIYIRETCGGQRVTVKECDVELGEDFNETLNYVYDQFNDDGVTIGPNWSGYKSFKYSFKGDFEMFINNILNLKKIKNSDSIKSLLNVHNLTQDYNFNFGHYEVVNHVLKPDVLKIVQDYYTETIKKGVWPLGDKQANRYKSHNEPLSRFIHYEVLPLVELVTGKKLRPTYTYLSAYVKGADLPGHTDRPDCEYTVSFIIDKPTNSEWNIYLHTKTQPEKYKGRYPQNPPHSECIAIDCDAGGLMIFQGTDRIHFREKLDHDYYNIILLHYCSI